MPKPRVEGLPPHLLYIEPVHKASSGDSTIEPPTEQIEAYASLGWVEGVPNDLEEDIVIGDLVVFLPWSEKNVPTEDYHSFWSHHYVVHEDDILLVIEDW